MREHIEAACHDLVKIRQCPRLVRVLCWLAFLGGAGTLVIYRVLSAQEEQIHQQNTDLQILRRDVTHIKETCDRLWTRGD
jgi:hypothetical protein